MEAGLLQQSVWLLSPALEPCFGATAHLSCSLLCPQLHTPSGVSKPVVTANSYYGPGDISSQPGLSQSQMTVREGNCYIPFSLEVSVT